MRKENLTIKVTELCREITDSKGNVIAEKQEREFCFRKGKPTGEGMPTEFCERNCELFKICEKVKSPVEVSDPKEDTLQVWCAKQELDSTYFPANVIEVFPELFNGVIKQDLAFRLSKIKEQICPMFCMDYVEGKECKRCEVPGDEMCMISYLLVNKVDKNEVEEGDNDTENE